MCRDVPDGVEVHEICVPVKASACDLFKQLRVFNKSFRRILRENGVDVVHTHFALPGAMARWGSHQERVPVVLTTHHEMYKSMSRHWRWALRITQRYCDAAVYISGQVRASFTPLAGRARHDRVIKNGIDVSELEQRKVNTTNQLSAPRIICVGRFMPIKGQTTLIEAWPTVLEQNPGARLCLVGEGPEKLALEKRCQELNIAHSVEFPGWLAREEALGLAGGSSFMVVPSFQEGFGLVVAEAMALRVPLVCSDIPVFREVAADTAHYFPVGNSNALAGAIIYVLSHPEQAKERADKASVRVAEHFNQCDMVSAYLQLYDELLTEKGLA